MQDQGPGDGSGPWMEEVQNGMEEVQGVLGLFPEDLNAVNTCDYDQYFYDVRMLDVVRDTIEQLEARRSQELDDLHNLLLEQEPKAEEELMEEEEPCCWLPQCCFRAQQVLPLLAPFLWLGWGSPPCAMRRAVQPGFLPVSAAPGIPPPPQKTSHLLTLHDRGQRTPRRLRTPGWSPRCKRS